MSRCFYHYDTHQSCRLKLPRRQLIDWIKIIRNSRVKCFVKSIDNLEKLPWEPQTRFRGMLRGRFLGISDGVEVSKNTVLAFVHNAAMKEVELDALARLLGLKEVEECTNVS